MLVDLLILILFGLLVYHLYKITIGYTLMEGVDPDDDDDSDDEQTCMTLATKNEKYIESLSDQISSLTTTCTQCGTIQSAIDSNTTQISSLVDQASNVGAQNVMPDDMD